MYKGGSILKTTDKKPRVLSHINTEVTFQYLEQKFNISKENPEIFKTAKRALNQATEIWQPKAVYRWVKFENTGINNLGYIVQDSGDVLTFDFGYSFQFLTHARYALISVYTAGQGFEKGPKHTSSKVDLLEAYFHDLIGLAVLDQVGQRIKEIAEEHARKLGWGVSPFLSPGSVHGWNLEEQAQLCFMLPIEKIDVQLQKGAVFYPLKTVSCLIGVGPEYSAAHVGTTCQVCRKNDVCLMKQNQIVGPSCLQS
ncbi:MAG: hypothetical protein PVG35_12905 [Desulfobacterales bacterium]